MQSAEVQALFWGDPVAAFEPPGFLAGAHLHFDRLIRGIS